MRIAFVCGFILLPVCARLVFGVPWTQVLIEGQAWAFAGFLLLADRGRLTSFLPSGDHHWLFAVEQGGFSRGIGWGALMTLPVMLLPVP